MSSWKALAWAKGQKAGSALAKVVLLLLAERADERYSCFPNLATLADEADSNRRSVRRILRGLEERGLITTVARTRSSGVSTSNRYFINHPEAPHVREISSACNSEPDPGISAGEDELSGGGGRGVRGRGTSGPPTRGASCPPLNYPDEHPTDHGPVGLPDHQRTAEQFVDSLQQHDGRLRFSKRDRTTLEPLVSAAIDSGWSMTALGTHLSRELPSDLINPAGLVRSRLTDGLPPPPAAHLTLHLPDLCGTCDNRWVQGEDGKLARCPRCHPAAVHQRTGPFKIDSDRVAP